MLWGIAVLLLVLWLVGMIAAWAMGAFVHLFLVLAVVAIFIQIFRRR